MSLLFLAKLLQNLLAYLKAETGILSSDPLTESANVLRLSLGDADGNRFEEE